MSATLLSLVQQAMGEMGLDEPTVVIASQDQQVKQCLRLLSAAGNEIARQHDWQALTKQFINNSAYEQNASGAAFATAGFPAITFSTPNITIDATYMVSGTGIPQGTYIIARPTTTTATLSQNVTQTSTTAVYTFSKVKYAMPSDYDRKVDRTDWDKSRHWEMIGPETAQQWEWLLSGFVATGPRIHYRIFGSYYQIWPPMSSAEVLGFEYISNAWIADSASTAKSAFTVDTDTCVFSDRLMVIALKLKFWQIKGFDTTALQRDYDMELGISKANDAGSATLSMAPRSAELLLTIDNAPDSGYGL